MGRDEGEYEDVRAAQGAANRRNRLSLLGPFESLYKLVCISTSSSTHDLVAVAGCIVPVSETL